MNKYLDVGEKKKRGSERREKGTRVDAWQEDGICKEIPSSNVVKDF